VADRRACSGAGAAEGRKEQRGVKCRGEGRAARRFHGEASCIAQGALKDMRMTGWLCQLLMLDEVSVLSLCFHAPPFPGACAVLPGTW